MRQMQRRKFISLFTVAAVGSPLAVQAQQQGSSRTLDEDVRRQLAEAKEETSRLLSMISDMNNSLAVMLGYTCLIRDGSCGETTDEMRDALHRIEGGGQRVAETIRAAFEPHLSKWRRDAGTGQSHPASWQGSPGHLKLRDV